MKHSLLLSKPAQRKSKSLFAKNMFDQVKLAQSLPSIGKALQSTSQQREPRLYDFVGSTQFKQSQFFPDKRKNTAKLSHKTHKKQDIQNEQAENNEIDYMSKLGNTTINRQTILSKLSNDKRLEATKDHRNLGRYKQYQEYWQNQSGKFKYLLKTKKDTLLQKSNGIYVQQNQRKDDIINNFVTSYWQMSLRNHNPILQRHIKGHKFQQVQLEELLQRDQGVKKVQNSIPILPIQAIKSLKKRDLSLTGRSRSSSIVRQNQSFMSSARKSKGNTIKNLLNQQQVFKISYEGDKKWMGYQGF